MYWFHGQQQIEKIVSAYNLISVFLFLCSLRLKRMSSTTRFYLVFGRCHCLNIEKISLRPAIANRAETTPIHQSKDHQSHTTRMEAIVKKNRYITIWEKENESITLRINYFRSFCLQLHLAKAIFPIYTRTTTYSYHRTWKI